MKIYSAVIPAIVVSKKKKKKTKKNLEIIKFPPEAEPFDSIETPTTTDLQNVYIEVISTCSCAKTGTFVKEYPDTDSFFNRNGYSVKILVDRISKYCVMVTPPLLLFIKF